jgi:hypothetical protein
VTRPTRATAEGRAYLDLQNLARRESRSTQELLILYVLERFLARLANGQHRERFVLKGGMLLAALNARRPTIDADLLDTHLSNQTEEVLARVIEIADTTANSRIRDYADVWTLTGIHNLDATQIRAALETTAAHRQITLRPPAVSIADLATARADTYITYRRRLGQAGTHLPEDLTTLIGAVITFVDPLLRGEAPAALGRGVPQVDCVNPAAGQALTDRQIA